MHFFKINKKHKNVFYIYAENQVHAREIVGASLTEIVVRLTIIIY